VIRRFCRTDEYYNEKYLDETNAEYVAGYDLNTFELQSFWDNLDVYEELEFLEYLVKPEHIKALKDTLNDWIELNRDQMITSMLDAMDEQEYEKMKERIDSGNLKPYILKYAYKHHVVSSRQTHGLL